MDCIACTELFTKTVRKRVECIHCGFVACMACFEKYMLSVVQDPHCMHCKKIWTREFIDTQFPKKFVDGDLKNHWEDILFEREKNLLAETQHNVVLLREQRQIELEIEKYQNQVTEIENKIAELEYKKNSIQPFRTNHEYHNEFRIPCPMENCRGFIENNKTCGICTVFICIHCREKTDEEHKCNPETLESVKALERDTKRCPNCMVQIFKSSGCNQMWCTNCRTAFDWITGELVKDIVHNPHYLEYVEKNGGEIIMNCQEGVMFCSIEDIIRTLREKNSETFIIHQIIEVYRYMIHYQQVVLPKYPLRFDPDMNLDLRMKYLINEISEDEFKKMLQRRQKDMEKKIEYRDVGDTYVNLINDMFRIFIVEKSVDKLIEHIRSITSNTQEAILQLNKRYTSSLPLVRTFL